MRRRHRIGKSDAQANAEALYRRDHGYTAASDQSFKVAWDFRQREPRNLREAVHYVRKAYQDEVPATLHDGPETFTTDGTPRMNGAATTYIFGSPYADDRPHNTVDDPMLAFYLKPFQAALAAMLSDSRQARRARIVQHIALGNHGPAEAALMEKAHPDDAELVAENACRVFLRRLTDVKVIIRRAGEVLPEGETAA